MRHFWQTSIILWQTLNLFLADGKADNTREVLCMVRYKFQKMYVAVSPRVNRRAPQAGDDNPWLSLLGREGRSWLWQQSLSVLIWNHFIACLEAKPGRLLPGRGIIGTGDRLFHFANIVGVCSKSTGRPECVSRASRR